MQGIRGCWGCGEEGCRQWGWEQGRAGGGPGLPPASLGQGGLALMPAASPLAGMVPVSKRSLDFLLRGGPGNAVVIVVGGAAESLDCMPGEHRVLLRGRRGFVRLALQHG